MRTSNGASAPALAGEAQRIAGQLRRSLHGEAWHGPALFELLAGVTASGAAAKPTYNVHSIWEIVCHVTAWLDAVHRRLDGHLVRLAPDEDWPAVCDTSEDAWRRTLEALRENGERLVRGVEELSEDRLHGPMPGTPDTVWFQLHGLVQHNLYHAGQIAVLKKG